jgi:hypothetical protein
MIRDGLLEALWGKGLPLLEVGPREISGTLSAVLGALPDDFTEEALNLEQELQALIDIFAEGGSGGEAHPELQRRVLDKLGRAGRGDEGRKLLDFLEGEPTPPASRCGLP